LGRFLSGGRLNSKASVLVTGATGFVGSHLIEALTARGLNVRALVRPTSDISLLERLGVERVVGSLSDAAALDRAVDGVGTVFHLAAAIKASGPADYERSNRTGTDALVKAMLATSNRPGRLIYLSSLAATGPSLDGLPVRGSDTPRPLTAYGRTKLAGEAACLGANGPPGTVVLRAAVVYGPRDRETLSFFRLAARGIFPIPAGPERRTQLIHARDVAEAMILAAASPDAGGVYHLADPAIYAWTEFAEMIGRAVGRKARVVRVPEGLVRTAAAVSEWGAKLLGRPTIFNREKAKEILAPAWICDTEALERDTGFRTRIPLMDGLVETATWYRDRQWI